MVLTTSKPRIRGNPINYYNFSIGDFNKNTRHLTLVERALYRELIDLYYESEKPIQADDPNRLAKRVGAKTDEERAALNEVLGEFFQLKNGAYHNARCDAEILIYQEKIEKASLAGRASALARAKRTLSKRSTPVQPAAHPNPNPTTQSQSQVVAPEAALAIALRSNGVNANSQHPTVIGWAERGVTVEQVTEAARIAVVDRGKERPSIGYLVGIVDDLVNPKRGKTASAIENLERMKG